MNETIKGILGTILGLKTRLIIYAILLGLLYAGHILDKSSTVKKATKEVIDKSNANTLQAENEALKQSLSLATLNQTNQAKALKEANEKLIKLESISSSNVSTLNSLRNKLKSFSTNTCSTAECQATRDAYITASNTVLRECTAKLTEMGQYADKHAIEQSKLMIAWGKCNLDDIESEPELNLD